METTDPQDEAFDVLTPDGAPAGWTVPRGEAHRIGLWHPAFHLWIAWRDGAEVTVLLQWRSLTKDTMPGRIDVSVGGHFRAGEYRADCPTAHSVLAAVRRELEEELGVLSEPGALRWFGTRWSVWQAGGVADREVQQLYHWLVPQPPKSLRPDPREVAAVLAVPARALRGVLAGHAERAPAAVLWESDSLPETSWRAGAITLDDLVPGRTRYWLAVLDYLERIVHGESAPPLVIRDDQAWYRTVEHCGV